MRDKVHASSPLSLSGGSCDVSSSRFIRSCSIGSRVSMANRHSRDSIHADAPSSSSSGTLLARSGRKNRPRSESLGPASVRGSRPRSLSPKESAPLYPHPKRRHSQAWTVQATAPHHAHQSTVSSDGKSSSALMRRWLCVIEAIRHRASRQVDTV